MTTGGVDTTFLRPPIDRLIDVRRAYLLMKKNLHKSNNFDSTYYLIYLIQASTVKTETKHFQEEFLF